MRNKQQKDFLLKKSDRIIYLLEYLLTIELFRAELNRSEIGKHITVEKAQINTMLKGIKKSVSRK